MSIYIRRFKKLTEEDNNQTQSNSANTQNNVAVSNEIAKLNQDIVTCQNAINTAEQRYQEEKKRQNRIILQKSQQIASLGGIAINVKTKNESLNYRFSKKLYEAVQRGKIDEMQDVILKTFEALPEISYNMNDKSSYNFARKIVAFLNERNWQDNLDHWNDVDTFLQDSLLTMNISLLKREMNEFISAFRDILKERSLFAWIFGNQTD